MIGIRYYTVDADIIESDEFYELQAITEDEEDPDSSWAAFGRLNAILATIYRNGFAIRLTRGRKKRLARDLDLTQQGLDSFIGSCVEAGWFDRGLWERHQAITSKGIQRRWLNSFSRRKKPEMSADDLELWLLDGDCQKCDAPVPETQQARAKNGPDWQPEGELTPPARAKNAGIGTSDCQKCALEEKRREDKREEEKTEEDMGLRLSGVDVQNPVQNPAAAACAPPSLPAPPSPLECLALHPAKAPNVFCDVSGKPHQTMLGAVRDSYAEVTNRPAGGPAWEAFARDVASICPAGCRAGPEECRQCFLLTMGGLSKFDPARASSPNGLVKKILRDERGS